MVKNLAGALFSNKEGLLSFIKVVEGLVLVVKIREQVRKRIKRGQR